MKLGERFLKALAKTYDPSTLIYSKIKGYDIAFKTDKDGNPIVLFVGKLDDKGNVIGHRFVRVTKKDNSGTIIKDHWDLKGKAT